jgi:hypothetical protein
MPLSPVRKNVQGLVWGFGGSIAPFMRRPPSETRRCWRCLKTLQCSACHQVPARQLGHQPQINLAWLSRKSIISPTIRLESLEDSPDADRHGGYQTSSGPRWRFWRALAWGRTPQTGEKWPQTKFIRERPWERAVVHHQQGQRWRPGSNRRHSAWEDGRKLQTKNIADSRTSFWRLKIQRFQ